ncbi:MAG: hypothetical protein NUV52_03150 [Candidatus Roizmanbacteria bacterium]|nr:hypothetical protein [Candidatus Roizmanbacteria bacterium]
MGINKDALVPSEWNQFASDPLWSHVHEIEAPTSSHLPVVAVSRNRFPLLYPSVDAEKEQHYGPQTATLPDGSSWQSSRQYQYNPITAPHYFSPVDQEYLDIYKDDLALTSLIRFRNTMIAPSKRVVWVEPGSNNDEKSWKFFSETSESVRADMRFVYPSGAPDTGVQRILGYRLGTGTVPVEDVPQLQRLSQKAGFFIEPSEIRTAGVYGVAKNYVDQLVEQGKLVTAHNIEDYFMNIVFWLVSASQAAVAAGDFFTLPYFSTRFDVEMYPPVIFLPYIAAAMEIYIKSIPQYMPNDNKYPVNTLTPVVSRMYEFMGNVIQHEIHEGSITQTSPVLQTVTTAINEMEKPFLRAINGVVHNPTSWNKADVGNRAKSKTHSYGEISNEIRSHGARLPKNREINYYYRARRGNI